MSDCCAGGCAAAPVPLLADAVDCFGDAANCSRGASWPR